MNPNPMMQNPMMPNQMMMNPMMNMGMGMNNNMFQNTTLSRLNKEYKLCVQDNDLIQIGCNFGLENDDIYHWRVTMVGPRDTPYENGLFTITVNFPQDYPTHGPEFKFKNKIYHLNVDFKNDFGHICINSLNEWRTTGKVSGKPGYAVKQALFDIFCLFYNQGIDSPYDDQMAMDYRDNPEKFNEIAKKWTKEFAPLC
jgi:ubiquitin-conjugating enzyme E2 D/E